VGLLQERHDVAQALALPDSEVERLTDAILWDVFRGGDFSVELDGKPFLNADERSHMTDVSNLARTLVLVEVAGLLAAVLAARALRKQRDRRGRALVASALVIGLLAVLVGVGSILFFEPLFVAFHGLFFAAGTWSFPPGSNLTTLFPEALFSDAAVLAGVLVLLSAGLVAWLGWRDLRVTDRC
jgi:integral membrane protein (TIGR01906 family)